MDDQTCVAARTLTLPQNAMGERDQLSSQLSDVDADRRWVFGCGWISIRRLMRIPVGAELDGTRSAPEPHIKINAVYKKCLIHKSFYSQISMTGQKTSVLSFG
jgi:hypothetical protein